MAKGKSRSSQNKHTRRAAVLQGERARVFASLGLNLGHFSCSGAAADA